MANAKKTKTVKHEQAPAEAKKTERVDHVAALPPIDSHPNARAKFNAERAAILANAAEAKS